VVRVEPSGDSVIAGRGAPGATIEMLRNGRSHARTLADTSGLFAFVPPPLQPGSHEISLSAIAPDGARAQSRESVTVVINEDRTAKPLVTLTSPDRPTVVLSAPEPSPKAAAAAEAPDSPAAPAATSVAAAPPAPQPPAPASPPPPAPRPGVKIASVEAEEGGRLFVSAYAAPGATVRLYLNESFIAPGGSGNDGKVSFAIGRGVRPGDYRVRVDDVDPVSGQVKSRAEVAFKFPAPLTVPLPPQVQPDLPGSDLPGTAVAGSPGAAAGRMASAAQQASREAVTTAGGATAPKSPGSSAAGLAARNMDPGTIVVPEINTAIVARGDNLWRISRRIYGEGTRYTVIYDANQTQIRNPNRIYPGQTFVLPSEKRAETR
jgi:nucleoid-associated protein YgaU